MAIDFGVSFGAGITNLPIPELMPFRFTQQFANVLQPLDAGGLILHSMLRTMRVLRAGKDDVLNTMEIFVKEPMLDWESEADSKHTGGTRSSSALVSAEDKVAIVQRKLKGVHPVEVAWTEIGYRRSKAADKDAMKEVVRTANQTGVEPNLDPNQEEETLLEEAQQVEVLLSIASDPNLLARAFQGWVPWV